jgi:hypothetical protein
MAKEKLPVPPIPPNCPFFIDSCGSPFFYWKLYNEQQALICLRELPLIDRHGQILIASVAIEYWRRVGAKTADVEVMQAAHSATRQWRKWCG